MGDMCQNHDELLRQILSIAGDDRIELLEQYCQQLGPEEVSDSILDLLSDPDALVRVSVVECLIGTRKPHHLLRLLALAFSDPEWLVRGWAVCALGESGAAFLASTIEKIARTDTSRFVRLNSFYALFKLGKREALNALMAFLQDSSYRLRIACCSLVRELTPLLTDNEKTRIADELRQRLNQEQIPSVREAVRRLLKVLK